VNTIRVEGVIPEVEGMIAAIKGHRSGRNFVLLAVQSTHWFHAKDELR
jgi:hypothetical protein